MKRVLVLGASGMLGYEVHRYLESRNLDVIGTYRGEQSLFPKSGIRFDVDYDDLGQLLSRVKSVEYVINCIGVIPQKARLLEPLSDKKMISVNSIFPNLLAKLSTRLNFRVIQIATDCVYSGRTGGYSESTKHDAEDLYGITKSLGEVTTSNYLHIRSSIIGRHDPLNVSLNNWFISKKTNAQVNGYTNHFWNGVTTIAFAKVVYGVLAGKEFVPGTRHLIPADDVSKKVLLDLIAEHSGRTDIAISSLDTPIPIDRRLRTENTDSNHGLWRRAGYARVPTISELIHEMYVNSMEGDHDDRARF